MPKITFYLDEKALATADLKPRSTQVDRDKVAKKNLVRLDYQLYNKFTITEDDGSAPRSAILTPYFQDAQGRIWKGEWTEDV